MILPRAQRLMVQHHHYSVSTHLGFGAWYGFAACIVLVLFGAEQSQLTGLTDDQPPFRRPV
jgi:hypothetical protein